MSSLSFIAPAKINLTLQVTGRRNDGYHFLKSLVIFAKDVADEISVAFHQSDMTHIFQARGPFASVFENLHDDQNLVLKAIDAYERETGLKKFYTIDLKKNIPAGAGLGGGSSNAAATISALEKLNGVKISESRRNDVLIELGADVPVCAYSKPCILEGIGEKITPAPPLPPFNMVLIWPCAHSATHSVFTKITNKNFTEGFVYPKEGWRDIHAFSQTLQTVGNDLQQSASLLNPVIHRALTRLQEHTSLYAGMSGSGSCVFGLFIDKEEAENAALSIKNQEPGWWVTTAAYHP